MHLSAFSIFSMEALIKSTRADVERFFGGLRFEKRRNTLCTRKGDVCERRRWRIQRAKRSGSGQNLKPPSARRANFGYRNRNSRIRKAPLSPTAAQYFKFFKPKSRRKRSDDGRRRFIQRFPISPAARAASGQDTAPPQNRVLAAAPVCRFPAARPAARRPPRASAPV